MLASCALVFALVTTPPPPATDRPLTRYIEATTFTTDVRPVMAPGQPHKDSLRNGTLIGGVLGAAVAAVGLGTLCHALHEPGDPSCWKGVLPWTIAGAGIGAAAGAGLDALFDRR